MNYKKLSEDELKELIDQKYGKDWNPATIDPDGEDELVTEYFDRVAGAID